MTTGSTPRPWPFVGLGVVLAAACLAGCGDSGPKLYSLTGEVKYLGQPVKGGTIRFEPAGEKMDPRAAPEAFLRDGRYEFPAAKGVAGGPYTVYILACDGSTQPELPYGKPLFPHTYVTKVDLPREPSTKDFDIPRQGK